jgi:hypothetical protein
LRKVVTGLPEFKVDDEGVCKGCAQGKNIKNPFPESESKAEGIFELIHSNVCSPMPSTSLSGYVDYVSFIDDYSCKILVYFLKSKDGVFGKFKEFKALIENISERKYSGQIMEENIPQKSLEDFAEMSGLRGISPLPKILSKMV